jgi:hypothetical protein
MRNGAADLSLKYNEITSRGASVATVLSPPEQRVVLHNVSWETYERILAEHIDCSSPRFTFDHGELEIVTLSAEHERYSVRIADLVGVLADEMDVEVEALGSTTYKRQELERGFEPDSCFYVENIERVRGKDQTRPGGGSAARLGGGGGYHQPLHQQTPPVRRVWNPGSVAL